MFRNQSTGSNLPKLNSGSISQQQFKERKIGWGTSNKHLIDRTERRLVTRDRCTIKEWDRFPSQIFVYELGRSPLDLSVKYRVDMSIYSLATPRRIGRKKIEETIQT